MLRKISLALVGLTVGSILTVVGFVAYALDYATLNLAGFFYGIPLLLGGLALKAAELKPIPFSEPTPDTILKLREKLAHSYPKSNSQGCHSLSLRRKKLT